MIELHGEFFVQTLEELGRLNIEKITLIGEGVARIDVRTSDGYVRGHHCFMNFIVECPLLEDGENPASRPMLERKYKLGLAQKAYGLFVKKMTKKDLIGLVGLLSEQLAKTCPLYKTLPEENDADPEQGAQGRTQ
jgi:hypothetical protein